MDRERVGTWLEGYRRAWEQADTPAVLGLFTADATYRSHPLRPAHSGHRGVADYWARATAGQQDVRVRFGDPVVDGDRVAAEWWTVMRADGSPVTLAGCLLLRFAPDGRCQALRECWNVAEELVDPPPGWGHLAPPGPQGPTDPGTGDPGAGGPAREHARRWAEGYEAAWRAGDPEAAAALYAPPTPTTAPSRSSTRTQVVRASSPTPATPRPPRPTRTPASAPRSPPAPRRPSSGGPPPLSRAGRPPSSAPRSSPSPPTAWSPSAATTGSWSQGPTPPSRAGAADRRPLEPRRRPKLS